MGQVMELIIRSFHYKISGVYPGAKGLKTKEFFRQLQIFGEFILHFSVKIHPVISSLNN
jgi:hypothetical protein